MMQSPFTDFNFNNPAAALNYMPGGNPGLIPPAMGAGAAPLGFNLDTLRLGLGGIQTIGNLWNAFEANKLAKEQFDFTKGITNTNLSNSIQSYNTSLRDRIAARSHTEGRPDGYTDAYLADNQLSRDPRGKASTTSKRDYEV
jgi:hypothetical protein